jgi:hypothetical protein
MKIITNNSNNENNMCKANSNVWRNDVIWCVMIMANEPNVSNNDNSNQ